MISNSIIVNSALALAVFVFSSFGIYGYPFESPISMTYVNQQHNEKWTKDYICERAKKIFNNIPDHCQVSSSVRNNLFTDDLYIALAKAWEVPHWYNEIGDEEFLYYFVTGNGGGIIGMNSIISTTIQSVGNNSCSVLIKYREYWPDDHSYSSSIDERSLVLVYRNDEWYLDDFSTGKYVPSVKTQCNKYIQSEISNYQSGRTQRQMKEESYSSQKITDVNRQFEAFIAKYGTQNDGSSRPNLLSKSDMSSSPTFKDGDISSFVEWILSKVDYPEYCIESHIEGDLVIRFTVDENGFIIDEKVTKSVEPSLDEEVMRYVSSSPKWVPGKENGMPVNTVVELTVPLRIKESSNTSFPLSTTTTSSSSSSSASTVRYSTVVSQSTNENVGVESLTFQQVDDKPSFNGGDTNEFSKWVNSRLVYPEEAKENGVQGRVVIQFTIEPNGQVSNVKVIRGVHSSLDKEAIRVVEASPLWKPGRLNGRNVSVTYTFPVIFQLK